MQLLSNNNDLTCQTCAYWLQRRGSFGVCSTFPEHKLYDGSRKGSACIGWRINNNINDFSRKKFINEIPLIYKSNSLQTFPKKVQEIKEHCPSLRKIYNDLHKPKFKATYATKVDGEFVTYTSDIHTKNGYYKHRYNYTLIDVALTLFLQGKTFKEVVEHMKGNYMKPMSRRTFRTWIIKFLGQQAWDKSNSNGVFAMCIDDHGVYVKDGKTNYGKQQYSCKICKRKTVLGRRKKIRNLVTR